MTDAGDDATDHNAGDHAATAQARVSARFAEQSGAAPVDIDDDSADDSADEVRSDGPTPADPPPAGPTPADPVPTAIDLELIERDLAGVEAALRRLDDGSYWTDEVTGEPLEEQLLVARPVARRNR